MCFAVRVIAAAAAVVDEEAHHDATTNDENSNEVRVSRVLVAVVAQE